MYHEDAPTTFLCKCMHNGNTNTPVLQFSATTNVLTAPSTNTSALSQRQESVMVSANHMDDQDNRYWHSNEGKKINYVGSMASLAVGWPLRNHHHNQMLMCSQDISSWSDLVHTSIWKRLSSRLEHNDTCICIPNTGNSYGIRHSSRSLYKVWVLFG